MLLSLRAPPTDKAAVIFAIKDAISMSLFAQPTHVHRAIDITLNRRTRTTGLDKLK